MSLTAVFVTFGVIFLAELPDKTMVASLVLGSRYRPLHVWVGVAAAFAIQVTLAVAAGSAISLLPSRVVDAVTALLFAVGAVLVLREGGEDAEEGEDGEAHGEAHEAEAHEEACRHGEAHGDAYGEAALDLPGGTAAGDSPPARIASGDGAAVGSVRGDGNAAGPGGPADAGPLGAPPAVRPAGPVPSQRAAAAAPSRSGFLRVAATSFAVVFVAELGDLTQISTANLAARFSAPVAVWLGAVLALWTVAGLAIAGGRGLLRIVSVRLITRIAATAFTALALLSLIDAVRG